MPYSLESVLHDREFGQHTSFKAWLDFNLQSQGCDEAGKQPKGVGHGRERRRFWHATGLYRKEFPAFAFNGMRVAIKCISLEGRELTAEHQF